MQFLEQVAPIMISVLSALASFLVVFLKTRTKVLEKKLTKDLSQIDKEEILSVLSKFYVVVDNKVIQLDSSNLLTDNELLHRFVSNV